MRRLIASLLVALALQTTGCAYPRSFAAGVLGPVGVTTAAIGAYNLVSPTYGPDADDVVVSTGLIVGGLALFGYAVYLATQPDSPPATPSPAASPEVSASAP